MTARIFQTLKSRLPPARALKVSPPLTPLRRWSRASKKAPPRSMWTAATRTPANATRSPHYANRRWRRGGWPSFGRARAKLANIRGEQDAMRRTALNGPDGADVGAALRREMRDSEIRALLRGMPLHERLRCSPMRTLRGPPQVRRRCCRGCPRMFIKPSSPTSPTARSRPNLATGPNSLPRTPKRLKRSPARSMSPSVLSIGKLRFHVRDV